MRSLRNTGLEGPLQALQQLSAHPSLADTLEGVDYVQESVVEDLALKREIFQQIETHVDRDAIIASSTSGLVPSALSAGLRRSDRLVVVHPLTPPHLLPVTEICAAPGTDPTVVDAVKDLLVRVGQSPILLGRELPGFALNRVLAALMNEVLALIEEGVLDPGDVDAMLTEGFGLRWAVIGPLAAMDLNAPGGIEEYLKRYGGMWETVARSRGMTPALTENVIARVAAAVRRRYRPEDSAGRIERRDRAIAEVRRLRSSLAAPEDH
jgi:3-hydroxyacyl-CoA dehydrogenase